MNDKKTTLEKVDEVFEVLNHIKKVETPDHFKEKVMQRISNTPSKTIEFLPWFTTKYQVAAILVFLFINITALWSYNAAVHDEKLETIADAYGISSSNVDDINPSL